MTTCEMCGEKVEIPCNTFEEYCECVYGDGGNVTVPIPDTNPKTISGLTKPRTSLVPPSALLHLTQAFEDGAKKYSNMNWRESAVSSTIYYDAAMRHLMAWFDGEEKASDSGVHHLAHAMACMAILLDAQSLNKLVDDRPPKGYAAQLIHHFTKTKGK